MNIEPVFDTEQAMAHFAAIVEFSDDAIVSKALDGTILTWNAGAERMYGYTAADAVGHAMTMLLPLDRPDEETEILERIARGDRVDHFDTVRRKKRGELIDVSLTISPIRDSAGRIIGASHVGRNVSDRRPLLDQLRHFAALVESSEDAIVSKGLDGTILTWNTGAEHIYGYAGDEAIGHQMTLLLPPDRVEEEIEILERISRGERVEHFETIRRKKGGDLINVSLTISPIRDNDGRITSASHVARNITDRKRLDQQLRDTQKLESLGVLAGGIAHDFNNLLTGILGNTSLALETLPSDIQARGILRDVVEASERASYLTRQLLAYAGKGRFVIERINLSGLVREITPLIQASIPKNVQLRLELGEEMPFIDADSSQMHQLIMNLIINGAEAIGSGEHGTVLVTTGMLTVDENSVPGAAGGTSELAAGTYISLEVRDTGCGMDEDTLSHIFDPFFTTKFTGRGLGLAAVQGIVRGHKARLKVDSSPGKGATFEVLFPAVEGTAAPKRDPASQFPSRNQLILVIDDEVVIRRTAKSMLEHYGYTVVLAEDGKEGVELFRILAEKVSAVLLDITMPVMNGEEAFRHLRAIDPKIKVILSSGYNELEAILPFTGKGIAGFLQKPYSAVALKEKVQAVLESRKAFDTSG